MIVSATYLWAVTTGMIPWNTDILFGTILGDIFIATVFLDGSVVSINN